MKFSNPTNDGGQRMISQSKKLRTRDATTGIAVKVRKPMRFGARNTNAARTSCHFHGERLAPGTLGSVNGPGAMFPASLNSRHSSILQQPAETVERFFASGAARIWWIAPIENLTSQMVPSAKSAFSSA